MVLTTSKQRLFLPTLSVAVPADTVNGHPWRNRWASLLTVSSEHAMLTRMVRSAAPSPLKLLICALSWQLAIPLTVSSIGLSTAAAQGGAERPSILVIPAHPSAGGVKVSPGVSDSVESVLVTHLQRSGHEVARLGRAQAALCSVADYACLAKEGKQAGGYVLDPLVQVNPDGTGFLTFTIADTKNIDNISSESVALGTPHSGRSLAKEVEKNAELLTQAATKLLNRVTGNQAVPAVLEPPKTTVASASKALTLELTGRGDVSSVPEGIQCPGKCAFSFSPDSAKLGSLTLTATPRLPASVVHWSGAPCVNSELAAPLQCQIVLNKDEHLRVTFDRSPTRKATTGVLWGLAVVGIASGAVFLALDGRSHNCISAAEKTCTYISGDVGLASLTTGVGFALAGALTFWVPR